MGGDAERSPIDDEAGITLGTIAAPANRHDGLLFIRTLDALVVTEAAKTVYLDGGYDTSVMHWLLAARGPHAEIAMRGWLAPLASGQRWVVERTTAWTNAHNKQLGSTEHRARAFGFQIAISSVITVVGRPVDNG